MNFLPIVERELRVRARQASTFWVRVVAGVVATLLCVQLLEISSVFGGVGQAGQVAYRALVVLSFVVGEDELAH